jgi:hypothetical protein
LTRSRAT